MNPLWRLDHTSFSYGHTPAVDRISAEFAPGIFHGIIGPNGSGKSTLLDLMAGLRRPSDGTVRFMNRAVAEHRRRELARRLTLVPQEFHMGFGFSVFDCVMMGRHCHIGRFRHPAAADFTAVDRAMAALDLVPMAARPVTGLSGGEKQRVMVARALAQDTPALLLDEATSSLDVHHTIAILRRCRKLVDAGRTVVAVLHDLNLACAFCDRLTVLDQGRIAAEGPVVGVMTPELIARVFAVEAGVDHSGAHPRVILHYQEKTDD